MRKKQRTETTRRINPDNLRRLTVEECNESYLKHNNPNMRRLSDEEYEELEKEIPKIHKSFTENCNI